MGWIGIILMLQKDVALISRFKGEARLPDARGATVMMVGEVAQRVCNRICWESSVPVVDIGITVPVGDIPMGGDGAPLTDDSMDPRNIFETVHGMPVYYGGNLNDSDYETP